MYSYRQTGLFMPALLTELYQRYLTWALPSRWT